MFKHVEQLRENVVIRLFVIITTKLRNLVWNLDALMSK